MLLRRIERAITMPESQTSIAGKVVAIWRYPVKSMLGEEVSATDLAGDGLLGDRAYALVDVETGKVVSAKNPRRWPNLFDFRASYVASPQDSQLLPAIQIILPNSKSVTTEHTDVESQLSGALGRKIRLARPTSDKATVEGCWPEGDLTDEREEVFEFSLPTGSFFDCATVHLITTSTLYRLRTLYPESHFAVERFRANFIIESSPGSHAFVENNWIGNELAIANVRLRIDRPCPRCIMTTLSQGNLPKDPAVLRAIVEENQGNVGIYASVVKRGRVNRGDFVRLS
jgi:uncharacterized protein